MAMNIDDDRFSPLAIEGSHPRRTNDLEDDPVPYVDGVAGSLNIIAFAGGDGMSYEQTEPIGENHHRYTGHSNPLGTVRPS